jgi:hypothetical protein
MLDEELGSASSQVSSLIGASALDGLNTSSSGSKQSFVMVGLEAFRHFRTHPTKFPAACVSVNLLQCHL